MERHRDLVLAFNEAVFNRHDVSAVDRFMAVDVLNRVTGARGAEEFKAVVRYVLHVAPDIRTTVDEVVAEDSRVAVFLTWTGTHQGEIQMPGLTIRPTGLRFAIRHVHLYRVADDVIIEHSAIRDDLSLLRQLGAL